MEPQVQGSCRSHGLWQVEKTRQKRAMSEEERFALDNYYAENTHSGRYVIIFRTFGAVFQKENM